VRGAGQGWRSDGTRHNDDATWHLDQGRALSQVVMAAVVTPGLWRVLTADRRRPATEDSMSGDGTRGGRRGPGLAIRRDAA